MDHKKIKPLGNRILIKRKKAATTKGGILLPQDAQEKPQLGEVLALGDNLDPSSTTLSELKVGDHVLFSSYGGTAYDTQDDNDYLIMSQDDIFAIVENHA